MCGELDSNILVNEEIFAQFLATARLVGAEHRDRWPELAAVALERMRAGRRERN